MRLAQSPILLTLTVITFAATSQLLAAPALHLTLNQLDANNFPFIFSAVTVDTSGRGVPDLLRPNFTIYEDGRVQSGFFDVVPPDAGGGVRLVDFVFLVDNSGSMGEQIAAVKNNVNAFADSLLARGIDFRLGAVKFGQFSGLNPFIFNNGNLTDNLATFHSWINSMSADGSFEPGLQAIYQAATTFNFRPGSQRHFLLITDEDSDSGSMTQTIAACRANNITVHSAVDCSFGSSYTDYCRPETSISGGTSGLVFSVVGPYNTILNVLGQVIGNTYILRYKTDNPVYDGQYRTVRLSVNAFGASAAVTSGYMPGAGPRITRTPATVDLSNNAPVAGSSLPISASIVDDIAPGVVTASVFFRTVGQPAYSSLPMANASGDVFAALLPPSAAAYPGLRYYITASDGQLSASDPTVDPEQNAYSIAVLPNVAPVITHLPVHNAGSGRPILILANITDTTHHVEKAAVYYRPQGTLLFQERLMSAVGSIYGCIVPAGDVTPVGIEYYIRAQDDLGIFTTLGPFPVAVADLTDTDGDGLPDDWEINGYDSNNDGVVDVDLPALGADPNVADIFVEVDWMGQACDAHGTCHDHRPDAVAVQLVETAFAQSPFVSRNSQEGIRLHVDSGQMGGGNEIAHQDNLGDDQPGGGWSWDSFDNIKNANFASARNRVFHYCLFVHNLSGQAGVYGLSRGISASDFVVSLGALGSGRGTAQQQAATFMHELGHNLSLRHGGVDDVHRKPNYLSIMNYSFALRWGLTIGSTGFHLDYQGFETPALDEEHLDERVGLNAGQAAADYGTVYYHRNLLGFLETHDVAHVNDPVNWNRDWLGRDTESDVSADLNDDGHRGRLESLNDWAHIVFNGGWVGALQEEMPTLPDTTVVDEPTVGDYRAMPPVPPRGLRVEPKMGFMQLTWRDAGFSADSGYSYGVFRAASTDPLALIGRSVAPAYADSQAASGVVNQYACAVRTDFGSLSALPETVGVVTYVFDGFSPPVGESGRLNAAGELEAESGRTIPLKYSLRDLGGQAVIGARGLAYLQRLGGDGQMVPAAAAGAANQDNLFRDSGDGSYIYDLSTQGIQGRWLLRLCLDDGTTHRIVLNLRRASTGGQRTED